MLTLIFAFPVEVILLVSNVNTFLYDIISLISGKYSNSKETFLQPIFEIPLTRDQSFTPQ